MTRVMRITVALAATVPLLPFAASGAELPVPASHHRVTHHVRHVHVPRQHFGYYFGQWGWRSGGTASSWYGSTFALAGGPWGGLAIVLKASPKSIVAIHCTERRPDACLGEPIIAAVPVAEPPQWR